ncbi:organic cation transporter protein-like isoform X2 [Glandiceps talaboti]
MDGCEQSMVVDFDEILNHLGGFGRFQKIVYSFLCLCMIPGCLVALGSAFTGASVPHVCRIADDYLEQSNVTVSMYIPYEYEDGVCQPSSCKRFSNISEHFMHNAGNMTSCQISELLPRTVCDNGWSFDIANHRSSIVTEWDLVCDKTWLRELGRSSVYIGILFGTFFLAPLSDRYGRKSSIFLAIPCNIMANVCTALSPVLEMYLLSQFILGCSIVGIYLVTYSYALEWVGPSKRAFVSSSTVVFYALAYAALGGIAYVVRDWRKLSFIMSLPSVLLLAYFWFLPESPRWLLSRGEVKEAEVIILKAARVNKADISPLLPKLGNFYLEECQKKHRKGGLPIRRNHSFIDLLRTPNLRRRCLNIFVHWTAISMVYYGVSLNTSSLAGNEYLNFFLAGMVEIPATLASIFLVDRYGRTITLSLFCILSGIGCICCQFVPADLPSLSITLAMIGKMGVAGAFWTAYIFTSELLPTVLRTTGLGAASCFGRIGAILAPFIQLLSAWWKYLPFLIYGSAAILAGLLILMLPDTKGKSLPSTIEEVESVSDREGSTTSDEERMSNDLKNLITWTSLGNLDSKYINEYPTKEASFV